MDVFDSFDITDITNKARLPGEESFEDIAERHNGMRPVNDVRANDEIKGEVFELAVFGARVVGVNQLLVKQRLTHFLPV